MREQRESQAVRHFLGIALIGLLLPTPASGSDLSISVDRAPNRVYVGDLVEYTVAVSNAGPETAADVTVRLSAPPRAGMLKASVSRGRCVVRRSAVICDLPALEPAGTAQFEVVARPIAPGEVASVGSVTVTSPPDPDPSNDRAEDVASVLLSRDPCSSLRLGTPGSDRLEGTKGGDAVFGRRGDDTILGGDRDDCLSGQDGDDRLSGGQDVDTLFGDAGADILDGGPGDDLARGGKGPDRITGAEEVRAGAGDDHIVAPPGAFVRCGKGSDFVQMLGTARLSGCERIAPPPSILPLMPAPDSSPVTGGGGGPDRVYRRRGGLRARGKHCRRRHCPRGGPIGGNAASLAPFDAADLSISLERGANRVFVGSVVRYTLTVSNAGPEPAPNVRARLVLPRSAGMPRASASAGRCTVRRNTAICRLAILEPQASAAFNVLARPIAPHDVIITGFVGAIGMSDPDPSDNLAQDEARIRLIPGSCTNLRLGTAVAELLAGTTGGDAIFGRRADDTLRGRVGEDCLSGQDGDDTLRGGDDDDTLFGDMGADVIDGGAGEDLAIAGSGADRIEAVEEVYAGPGNDQIVAPPDSLVGCGDGTDFVELLGPAIVDGCEQVVGPPPPLPQPAPPPAPDTGEQADPPQGHPAPPPSPRPLRRRGGSCRRRYCPRGGTPGWNAAFSRPDTMSYRLGAP